MEMEKENTSQPTPLEGIRVIDLTHFIGGPYTTLLLGAFGAEVIKIERPVVGELSRELGPFLENEKGEKFSSYYMRMNRNKKAITLDLKSDRGREIFMDLLKISDVLVESFKPGTIRKYGLSWDNIRSVNSRIVYASISGYGHADIYPNPFGNRLAFDIIAQAISGLMDITGAIGGPPERVGAAIGDIFPGALTALGIVIALLGRTKSNQGRRVDVAMYDALVSLSDRPIMQYCATGCVPNRGELAVGAPYNAVKTSDGWIVIAVFTNDQWFRLCRAMEREDLVNHPELKTAGDRLKNYHRIFEPILTEWAQKRNKREVLEILIREEVAAAPVQDSSEVLQCSNLAARNMLVDVKAPNGEKIKLPGIPIKMSGVDDNIKIHPSKLGQHTEEVLTGLLKIKKEEIKNLRRQKVI
jgi:CoA:oxalate CoA-transferase